MGTSITTLPSYRSAAELYKRFRDETEDDGLETPESKEMGNTVSGSKRFPDSGWALERDLQIALRSKIEQLEPGLS